MPRKSSLESFHNRVSPPPIPVNKSEDKYRSFIENLPVLFYAVHPAPPYSPIYVSPAFEKFGYPLDLWTTDTEIWLRVIHQDDLNWVFEKAAASTLAGDDFDHEYRIVDARGDTHWVRDISRMIRDENRREGVILDIPDRRLDRETGIVSEERYRSLFENANDIIYVHDLEGNYLSVNRAAERVFGYTREEALKMNMKQMAAPEHLTRSQQMLTKNMRDGKQTSYEMDCIAKGGRRVTVEINSCAIYQDGKPTAVLGIARDITERKRAEEALKNSEEQYRDLFENAHDLIYTHDLSGIFTSLNRAGERITGYSREEAVQLRISDVVAPDYIEFVKKMTQRKLEGELPDSYELEIIAKDGRRVMLELSTRLVYHDDKPIAVQGIGRDITSRRHAEVQLRHHARHDALTNLPNRTEFMEHLQTAVERTQSDPDYKFGVLFLDLDRFKVINDNLGHVIGDKLLVGISKRLSACIRPLDIVARFGGDEFTILLNKITSLEDATVVAERLQSKLSASFKFGSYEVFTSASIGIIVSDDIGREAEDYLRDADSAMYRAKETGKARCEVFDREMHVRSMNLLQVETDLRRAVDRREFEVHYQPIVSLETGAVNEFEALIRWRHPLHGVIGPKEFLSIAEETGLIVPIGQWILKESCTQIARWQKEVSFPLSISVNLSAKQLMHPSFTDEVKQVVIRASLHPSQLKFEIIESIVTENSELALTVLSDLSAFGISLSTDEFGTGYASLSYLQKFPFNRLKIDASFVDKMNSDAKTEAIVKTILMLGDNLGIEVVAVGVETEEQLAMLRSHGCRLGQGNLFSVPEESRAAARMLHGTFESFEFTRSLEDPNTINMVETLRFNN